jgi:hypothetical protein
METFPICSESWPWSSEKKWQISRKIRILPPSIVVLAMDETDLRLFPVLRAGYGLVGQKAQTHITGKNAKRVVYGAINIRTGYRILLVREKKHKEDFHIFLGWINFYYRGWPVHLLLDEDSTHTAYSSIALAKYFDIKLLWLPPKCPKLNPMDQLWRHAKDQICANYQYESIDEQANRFIQYVRNLSNKQALIKAAMKSDSFWLHKAIMSN